MNLPPRNLQLLSHVNRKNQTVPGLKRKYPYFQPAPKRQVTLIPKSFTSSLVIVLYNCCAYFRGLLIYEIRCVFPQSIKVSGWTCGSNKSSWGWNVLDKRQHSSQRGIIEVEAASGPAECEVEAQEKRRGSCLCWECKMASEVRAWAAWLRGNHDICMKVQIEDWVWAAYKGAKRYLNRKIWQSDWESM